MALGRKGRKAAAATTTTKSSSSSSSGSQRASAATADAAGGDAGIVATVRGLAEVVTEHALGELIVDLPGATITLRRGTVGAPVATIAPVVQHLAAAPAAAPIAAGPAPIAAPAAPAVVDDGAHVVTSPFVGTFYRRPNPDTPPYVQLNERVEKGAVLCIVEAMKLMNEIEADVAGTVVGILVEDGATVEYGQPLYRIRP